MPESYITAAVLVIGDEILSGSVKDKNVGVIAEMLTDIGVDLREVRIVPDDRTDIVEAVNVLRTRYTYVFTTGGLGPTHDDITADCIAEAFGVGIDIDERARAMLLERHSDIELNAARLRMARIPIGADLIKSPVTKAPGFRLGNVFVMAGVPQIMVAMLEEVRPLLESNSPIISRTIEAGRLPESSYAVRLEEIAKTWSSISIGSYPKMTDGSFRNNIIVRGRDVAAIDAATEAVETLILALDDADQHPEHPSSVLSRPQTM